MNAVKEGVKKLAEKELKDANTRFPLFSSAHEGYAIIKEEVDEVIEEVTLVESTTALLWQMVKECRQTEYSIEKLYTQSIDLAVEAIQVAAMCLKFQMSKEAKEHYDDNRTDNRATEDTHPGTP